VGVGSGGSPAALADSFGDCGEVHLEDSLKERSVVSERSVVPATPHPPASARPSWCSTNPASEAPASVVMRPELSASLTLFTSAETNDFSTLSGSSIEEFRLSQITRGMRHLQAKLSEDEVRERKQRYQKGNTKAEACMPVLRNN